MAAPAFAAGQMDLNKWLAQYQLQQQQLAQQAYQHDQSLAANLFGQQMQTAAQFAHQRASQDFQQGQALQERGWHQADQDFQVGRDEAAFKRQQQLQAPDDARADAMLAVQTEQEDRMWGSTVQKGLDGAKKAGYVVNDTQFNKAYSDYEKAQSDPSLSPVDRRRAVALAKQKVEQVIKTARPGPPPPTPIEEFNGSTVIVGANGRAMTPEEAQNYHGPIAIVGKDSSGAPREITKFDPKDAANAKTPTAAAFVQWVKENGKQYEKREKQGDTVVVRPASTDELHTRYLELLEAGGKTEEQAAEEHQKLQAWDQYFGDNNFEIPGGMPSRKYMLNNPPPGYGKGGQPVTPVGGQASPGDASLGPVPHFEGMQAAGEFYGRPPAPPPPVPQPPPAVAAAPSQPQPPEQLADPGLKLPTPAKVAYLKDALHALQAFPGNPTEMRTLVANTPTLPTSDLRSLLRYANNNKMPPSAKEVLQREIASRPDATVEDQQLFFGKDWRAALSKTLPKPKTLEEARKLGSGAQFVWTDGSIRSVP